MLCYLCPKCQTVMLNNRLGPERWQWTSVRHTVRLLPLCFCFVLFWFFVFLSFFGGGGGGFVLFVCFSFLFVFCFVCFWFGLDVAGLVACVIVQFLFVSCCLLLGCLFVCLFVFIIFVVVVWFGMVRPWYIYTLAICYSFIEDRTTEMKMLKRSSKTGWHPNEVYHLVKIFKNDWRNLIEDNHGYSLSLSLSLPLSPSPPPPPPPPPPLRFKVNWLLQHVLLLGICNWGFVTRLLISQALFKSYMYIYITFGNAL